MRELFDSYKRLLLDVCSPAATDGLREKLERAEPEKLKEMADRELLSPLFYHRIKAAGIHSYDNVLPPLKDVYLRNTARNTLLLRQLKTLNARSGREGIRPIVLKGAALAASVYDGPGLRLMTDVDVLVRPEDIGRMRAVMEHNGMHPLNGGADPSGMYAIKSHIVPYQSADDTLSLEVHTRLLDDRFMQFPDIDAFDNTRGVTWDNETFLVLGPVQSFLYTLYHVTIHHNFSFRLRDIVDLSYLIARGDIAPDEIISSIASKGAAGLLMPVVDTALALAGVTPGRVHAARAAHVFLYWTNRTDSPLLKSLPVQVSSRLPDPALRIAVMLTSGVGKWLPHIFGFTDFEVAKFYGTAKGNGTVRKCGMRLWLAAVGAPYLIGLIVFSATSRIKWYIDYLRQKSYHTHNVTHIS